MRLFNAQIIDAHLEGANAYVHSSEPFSLLLARAEALKFTVIVDGVSAIPPTLVMWISGGTADVTYDELTAFLINSALVSGINTFYPSFSPSDPTYPPPRHLDVYAQITGTNPKAHVQVWVCGRGPQLLETVPAVQASFSAQYAAARMLADEDRLPLRQRSLRQGASLFYPPELFLPSLKWER